ncbi:MAG: hypothetical protein ACT4PL_11155, partial [Phycisphaerales bacterium]
IGWWLGASHCQSRFLLPLIVPLCVAAGLAMACEDWGRARRLIGVGVVALTLVLSAFSARLFLSQNPVVLENGEHVALANVQLIEGLSAQTGSRLHEAILRGGMTPAEALGLDLPPSAVCNLVVPQGSVLYLLGDSTPLCFTGRVVYHTTYDESPLGREVRAFPDDPESWTRALRNRGIDHVLVNLPELSRLCASGWYDPSVTPEIARRWVQEWGEPIRTWGEGIALVRLKSPPPARSRAVQGETGRAPGDARATAVAR